MSYREWTIAVEEISDVLPLRTAARFGLDQNSLNTQINASIALGSSENALRRRIHRALYEKYADEYQKEWERAPLASFWDDAYLRGFRSEELQLSGLKTRGLALEAVSLNNCILKECEMSDFHARATEFVNTRFVLSSFTSPRFDYCPLTNCEFMFSALAGARLTRCRFSDGTRFQFMRVFDSVFVHTDGDVEFDGVAFKNVTFECCDMTGFVFRNCDFAGNIMFKECDVRGIDFGRVCHNSNLFFYDCEKD